MSAPNSLRELKLHLNFYVKAALEKFAKFTEKPSQTAPLLAFTCSKSTMETLGKGVKYVQS